MGVHNFSSLAVLYFTLLVLVHLCDCRHLNWAANVETEPRTRTKSSFQFPLNTISHFVAFEGNKANNVRTVSHPVIPGGPNPLHN